jgi:hydrogenase expression/formation protein
MDLEGFARRKILEGCNKELIIGGLEELIGEYKDWTNDKKHDFSAAIFEEVQTSLGYKKIRDPFLNGLLDYPRSGVSMGEFGVGSRGLGDFKVHRDIADIIGKKGALIGPLEQDDAGVVEGGGSYVTVAVDGIHSRLSEFPFLAGFHAARAALRDVYVMGSKPIALLSDLHLADDGDVGKLFDFTAGAGTVSEATSVPIVSGSTLRVGGDMVFGDRLVAAVGAVGISEARPLARRYARSGDVILLTLGKGGGTIATTAIYSGNFKVIKETLNIDFMRSMEFLFQNHFQKEVDAMTDVTNGGLRGDAVEISNSAKKRLVFFEEEVRKSVSQTVLKMLDSLRIDYLGVSTDSLMLILPREAAATVKEGLEEVTPVFEVGYVEAGEGALIITENGEKKKLKPSFRESPYTKVKTLVGEAPPDRLREMSKALDASKEEAKKKKEKVREWLAKE